MAVRNWCAVDPYWDLIGPSGYHLRPECCILRPVRRGVGGLEIKWADYTYE